ncbi:DUF5131 family protein [Desulfosporosinus sp. OT]|uniref:DUF5131 family protein n=1 Tax=Desulfosporosinus sp. OT TaxID=913865 RepID=UPI000223A757|nr:DUF5131 family protein [Desulfosporosinus sp. OT]EGW39135.1 hypothetical protein DOT_2943 [Desulfosporosinus sp. OT]
MNKASWHTFQVLTKRAERLEELAPYLKWSPNIWQGVTVESDQYKYHKYRIDSLRKVNAKVRFISFEPLIDEVKNLDLTGVDWAIVGGESGFKSRRMDSEWVLSIKNECDQQGECGVSSHLGSKCSSVIFLKPRELFNPLMNPKY